jgi:hypothetical protein
MYGFVVAVTYSKLCVELIMMSRKLKKGQWRSSRRAFASFPLTNAERKIPV